MATYYRINIAYTYSVFPVKSDCI